MARGRGCRLFRPGPQATGAGGERPIRGIAWRYYAAFGHKDLILCLGYKGEAIKKFFLDYDECLTNDFVLEQGGAKVEVLQHDINDWRITFVDTGQSTNSVAGS